MRTYFASEVIAAPIKEKGKNSQLFGWILEEPDTRDIIQYFPKYRDLLQAIQLLYEKEDIRYLRSRGYLGYEKLWRAIQDARNPQYTLEEICRKFQLPPPHWPLPIRRLV